MSIGAMEMKPQFNSLFSYRACNFCPRNCGADRTKQTGYCKSPAHITAARAALHHWEEPCISGIRGSGTVFFSGCTLRCCFCQNYKISCEGYGKEISPGRLCEIFLDLQEQGAHNINLVTATQYLPSVLEALENAKKNLHIPVVYNCGGYETAETIGALSEYVDIWLPDLKYYSPILSRRYSQAEDYFAVASRAVEQMIRLTGPPEFGEYKDKRSGTACSILRKGVIIRHMVLPGHKDDSIRLLYWMKDTLPKGGFLISLMSQYTPFYRSPDYQEINRRITTYEYEKVLNTAIELGLSDGFMQEKSSAKEEYTPPFELEGL